MTQNFLLNFSIRDFRVKLAIIVIAFSFCITVNFLNISYIKNHYTGDHINTKSLVHEGTVHSVDNAWYLTPAINLITTGVYAQDPSNPLTFFRRTPGYPLFYGMHYYLLGEQQAHQVIGYIQSLIFAISSLLLGLGVFYLSRNNLLAVATSLLYGLCPFACGYTFFTITEAIHPAFNIFAFFFLGRYCNYQKPRDAFMCGLFLAITAMIRPTNILFGIPIALSIAPPFFKQPSLNSLKPFLLVFAGLVLIIGPWTVRNYILSNEFVPLEKFSHESPMGMGRSQTYMSRWWMCFGNPHPESLVFAMIEGSKQEEHEKYNNIDSFINELPSYAFSGSSKQDVKHALVAMQDCYETKNKLQGSPIKTLSPNDREASCEFTCKEEFEKLINNYKISNPFRYYIVSPYITRGKEFIFQSFSSMYGSLNPQNQEFSLIQKICKASMYVLNVSLFLSLMGSLFVKKNTKLRVISISFILVYIVLLVNIVHIETRYLLGAYPFLYILLSLCMIETLSWIGKKVSKL